MTRWKKREEPGQTHIMDYWFDHRIEKAAYWRTKEEAEADCVLFNNLPISIPSSQGGIHVCKGWQVEERALGEYVVFCEAPFILTKTGEAEVSQKTPTGYKTTMDSFNPVAIRLLQHEVHAPDHTNWGTVTCDSCFEQFAFGPNRIYGVRGIKTADDYAKILEAILSNDHKRGQDHQNAYDLGE
ncbi:MAG TPA: hypothetical protein VHA33_22540 [Candidatus Angelobacter sp.]|nr:hypothetical protein [Candidatus Angelobacter sp.]